MSADAPSYGKVAGRPGHGVLSRRTMPAHNRHTADVNAGRGREAPAQIFKVTPQEKRAIAALAKRYGVTASEWCRYRALTDGAASERAIARLREANEL